jgi:hypothetical protein
MRFSGHDFSGAAFFGKACSLDPLRLIDPDVAAVVGQPPFTGAYVYGNGWIPVSQDVLHIPPSCMFQISAGVGSGAFFFLNGPTFGGKMTLGVSGEALCLVGISGTIGMTGSVQPQNAGSPADKLAFHGAGRFKAEIGPCPFCWTWSKTVGLDYRNRHWYMNF